MRAHEPSMEEILASIRRIIADDDSLPNARREKRRENDSFTAEETAPSVQSAYPGPALEPVMEPRAEAPRLEPRHEAEPAPVAEIRQLRLNRAAPEPVLVAQQEAEEEPDTEDFELSEALDAAEEEGGFELEEPASPLVSSDAASSIASHFQALAASMVINDSGLLQKYAQEMLRPMLKQWLDDNLPVIVERLVRAEIERVARGGRR